MRVLIAGDDAEARDAHTPVLLSEGHDVFHAFSVPEANEKIYREGVRVVLIAGSVGGLPAEDFCHFVRSNRQGPYVYLIVETERRDRVNHAAAMDAGADDVLSKPIDPAELVLRVRAARRLLDLEGRDMAMFALAKLADSRDPETGAHLERTRAFCRTLAEAAHGREMFGEQLDWAFIELIERTSPLHDVGKIGVPDSVLLKAGRLTDAEFEVMKQHTIIGAETLGAALDQYPHAGFLRMARDIALNHHERWGGGGYPRGISGERIPLEARIMSIADVYDAVRSERVYKPPLSHMHAKAIIANGAGTQFDPALVEVFLEIERDFETLYATITQDPVPAPVTSQFAA